jgi:hypothetical protein
LNLRDIQSCTGEIAKVRQSEAFLCKFLGFRIEKRLNIFIRIAAATRD